MSKFMAQLFVGILTFAGCGGEVVEKTTSDSGAEGTDATTDDNADDGGGATGDAGPDGGGTAGDDDGTGGDDGGETGDVGGSDDSGDTSGDGGTGDGGDAGGDAGGDHAYDGMWKVSIEVTAAIERSSGTVEGSCTGAVDAVMQFPELRSIIECDFNGFGDPSMESGEFEIVVDADETNLTGLLTLGPLPMELVGTIDGADLSATFYGEGSAGGSRETVMEGTMTATKL